MCVSKRFVLRSQSAFTATIQTCYSSIGWLKDFIGVYIEQLQKWLSDNYLSHPISAAEAIIPWESAQRGPKPHGFRERVLSRAEVNFSKAFSHCHTKNPTGQSPANGASPWREDPLLTTAPPQACGISVQVLKAQYFPWLVPVYLARIRNILLLFLF